MSGETGIPENKITGVEAFFFILFSFIYIIAFFWGIYAVVDCAGLKTIFKFVVLFLFCIFPLFSFMVFPGFISRYIYGILPLIFVIYYYMGKGCKALPVNV